MALPLGLLGHVPTELRAFLGRHAGESLLSRPHVLLGGKVGSDLPVAVSSLLFGDALRSLLVAVNKVLNIALQSAGRGIARAHISLASCLVCSRFSLIRESRLDGFDRPTKGSDHLSLHDLLIVLLVVLQFGVILLPERHRNRKVRIRHWFFVFYSSVSSAFMRRLVSDK